EHHCGECRAECEVKHVFGRHPMRTEDEHQERHHDHAAADAEQPGGETDQRANAEIRRPLHQARKRWSTSSTNPAPDVAPVTNLGIAGIAPTKRWMLATPTEFGKKANIGASFGESPT